MARIYIGDDGDVELMHPPVEPLQANLELQAIEAKMEMFAGSPKEAAGFRTPGEKTAYEVQRIENAAARIFSSKIVQFEEQIIEPHLNAAFDFGQRLMDNLSIRVFDDQLKIYTFQNLTKADIMGTGRIRPMAARNFAERAERLQNLTNFFNSNMGQDPAITMHMSGVKTAQMIEDLIDLKDYKIVIPYIRISEENTAQQQHMAQQEQVQMQSLTPAGVNPDDTNQPFTK